MPRRLAALAVGAALVGAPVLATSAHAADPVPAMPTPAATGAPVGTTVIPLAPPGESNPFDYILFGENAGALDERWPRLRLMDADGKPVEAPLAVVDFTVTANGQTRLASDYLPAKARQLGDGDVLQRVLLMTDNPKVLSLTITITELRGLPPQVSVVNGQLPLTAVAEDRRKHFAFDDIEIAVNAPRATTKPTPTKDRPAVIKPTPPRATPAPPRATPAPPRATPAKPTPKVTSAKPTPRVTLAQVTPERTPAATRPQPVRTPVSRPRPEIIPPVALPTPTPTLTSTPVITPEPTTAVTEDAGAAPVTVQPAPVEPTPEPEETLVAKVLKSPATPMSGGAIVTMALLLATVPPTGFRRP